MTHSVSEDRTTRSVVSICTPFARKVERKSRDGWLHKYEYVFVGDDRYRYLECRQTDDTIMKLYSC